jgi:hypothetical protein
MNPDPTRLKIGDTLVEVRMNLIVNNLPVDHENLLNTEQAAKFLHVSVESLSAAGAPEGNLLLPGAALGVSFP